MDGPPPTRSRAQAELPSQGPKIVYTNFYSILFNQANEECTLEGRNFFWMLQERFRERLHEPKDLEVHKNIVRAYYVLSHPDRRKAYDSTNPKRHEIDLGDYLKSTQRKAEEGDLDGVKRDVEAGIKLNSADENGHTPLYVACRAAQEGVVDWMLEHGADPVCLIF